MKASTSMDLIRSLKYVRNRLLKCLVYSTVRLRLPDDNLLKQCINFITDHIKDFTVKDTSVILWALARMSYPSKHLETLMMKKIE